MRDELNYKIKKLKLSMGSSFCSGFVTASAILSLIYTAILGHKPLPLQIIFGCFELGPLVILLILNVRLSKLIDSRADNREADTDVHNF